MCMVVKWGVVGVLSRGGDRDRETFWHQMPFIDLTITVMTIRGPNEPNTLTTHITSPPRPAEALSTKHLFSFYYRCLFPSCYEG